ncbi:hypothetical protein P8452_55604 [Trifolium repens]|nr:hypothetical protein P8452_55604 [Trifolium repens]
MADIDQVKDMNHEGDNNMSSHDGAPKVLSVHKRKTDKKEKGTRKIPKKADVDNVNKLQSNLIEKRTPSEYVQDNEANQKLISCIHILEKLEGIGGGPFTKALKILKEDSLWRDVFLALSDDRRKDFVLNI